jgi:predicted restriction endonuclease
LASTDKQYDTAVQICRDLFEKKMHDYGCAWRILRVSSLTDQIFIKAQRIRTLQQSKTQRVDEGQFSEFIGIVNYCVMALIQIQKGVADQLDMSPEEVMLNYNAQIGIAKSLMQNKNHDYGEAWRDMRVSSLTDLILQKLLRVKQIEDNDGQTLVSEGLAANYQDMINYAIFTLIHLEDS